MKTKIRTTILAVAVAVSGALALSTSAHAATVSGGGCNVSGTVSFVYANSGTSLLLINGMACFASSLTAGDEAALAAIASEGLSSGRKVTVGTGASLGGGSPTALSVVIQ